MNSKHHTAAGIAALVHGCAKLWRVFVRADDPVVTPLSRMLWQSLRPGITFNAGTMHTTWAALFDAEM
jgi:hypothetical protein